MPNTFSNAKRSNVVNTSIGTGTAIYTPAAKSIIIGCMISNKTANDVLIDLAINNGGTYFYLAKDVTIFAGTSLEVLDAKVVLVNPDILHCRASAANAVDCVVSLLEGVN